jgi:natural product biosynthesis luciferase-like monooxygenase protein
LKFGLLYLPTYVPELDGPVGVFYDRMLEQIARADELGYHSVWLTEHHFDVYGGTVPNPAVLGAVVARTTRRIRVGTAVTVLPMHNPLLVAEDFAMLDVLSNGRLDMGIGRGSVGAEYREFGISNEDSASTLAEAADLLLKAWSQERFSHHGQHYAYDNISLVPRPIQQPHPPIYVGASRTAETFTWTGAQGFHLMVLPYMFPPEYLQERIGLYFDALRQAGHDPKRMDIMAKFHVFVAESREEASRLAGPAYDNYQRIARNRSGREHKAYWRDGLEWDEEVQRFNIIAGTPEDCIERIRYWREQLGLTHIGGTFHFGGLAQDATLRSIELFAREVAPVFTTEEAAAAA